MRLLHAVVGFGHCDYFYNCIDSILKNDGTNSKVHVLITGGFDQISFQELKLRYVEINERIQFSQIEHHYSSKVGSLYEAMNFIVKRAYSEGFDYLNVIQNDMQLMHFDFKLFKLIDDVFSLDKNYLMMQTGYFRRGSHPEGVIERRYLISNTNNLHYLVSVDSGLCDWGIIHLNRMVKSGLVFTKNETWMASYACKIGFKMPVCPIPYIACVPWPAVIRKGKSRGRILKKSSKNLYMHLKNIKNRDESLATLYKYQDDYIGYYDRWILHPIWVTDGKITYFIKALKENNFLDLEYCREGYKSRKFIYNFYKINYYPNIYDLIVDTYFYILSNIKHSIAKIIF